MPPYKFDSSRAWGRHYGQDFGGGSAVVPLMLAVGNNIGANQMWYSLDAGTTWLTCTVPNPGDRWRSAAYSPTHGYAIAVCRNGVLGRSFDGITWTLPGDDLPNLTSWDDIIWNDPLQKWVCVNLLQSPNNAAENAGDGLTGWVQRGTPARGFQRVMANAAGRMVGGNSGASNPGVMTSADGTTWVNGGNYPPGNDSCSRGAKYDAIRDRIFMAGGSIAVTIPDYYTDDGGLTMNTITRNGLGAQASGNGIGAELNQYISVSVTSGLWLTSASNPGATGSGWVNVANPAPFRSMVDLYWIDAAGTWVGAGAGSSCQSPDGSAGSWTSQTPGTLAAVQRLVPLAFGT